MTEESVGVLIFNGAGATTIDIAAEIAWTGLLLSLTDAMNVAVPLEVGIPVMAPVACTKVRPAGRLPDAIVHL